MKSLALTIAMIFFLIRPLDIRADEIIFKDFKHELKNLKARTNPRKDINEAPCALILVRTTFIGLGIKANNGAVGNIEYKDGEYWVYVSEGTRRLSFFASGVTKKDFDFPERIAGAEVYILVIDIKYDQKNLSIENSGYLLIESSPGEANVYIDGKPTGMRTPLQVGLMAGNYRISVTRPGSISRDTTLSVKKEIITDFRFQLKNDQDYEKTFQIPQGDCDLEFVSDGFIPDEIVINGEKVTAFSPGNKYRLKPGKNYCSIYKQHFIPFDTIIQVSDQKVLTLKIPVRPCFGSVVIFTDQTAEIIVDKKKVAMGHCSLSLFPGYHILEIVKEKYNSPKRLILIKQGFTDTISVTLGRILTNIQVNTNPPGASLYINDSLIGVSPYLVKGLPVKLYTLKIVKTGYATIISDVDAVSDQTYLVEQNLAAGKQLKVRSFPNDAEVVYQNHVIGKTPMSYSFPSGKIELKVKKTGYDEISDTINTEVLVDSVYLDLTKSQRGPDMVYVTGGCFKRKQGWTYFDVCLDNFYMSRSEITNKEFCAFLNAAKVPRNGVLKNKVLIGFQNSPIQYSLNEQKFIVKKGLEKKPVAYVTWYGAQEFCKFYKGRLPTEAEWLFAAQELGKNTMKFSGSDDIDEVGWYSKNSDRQVKEVGTKKPNALGLVDLTGNLMEWCFDWYSENYFVNSPRTNPMGPAQGWSKVLKGGSYDNSKGECEVLERYNTPAETSNSSIGFRMVVVASEEGKLTH